MMAGRVSVDRALLVGSVASLWVLLVSVAAHAASSSEGETVFPNGTLRSPWRVHTLFSVECHVYFDWQTVGIMHSFRKSGQPGPVTRLLSCTDEQLQGYRGLDLAPTHQVPSMSQHPVTGDWYTPSLPIQSLHYFFFPSLLSLLLQGYLESFLKGGNMFESFELVIWLSSFFLVWKFHNESISSAACDGIYVSSLLSYSCERKMYFFSL